MKTPIAVLISDVHYNLQTLPLADKVMRMAIDKANLLSIPLVVAGDLHDSKANMRAECVNAMIETFKLLRVPAYVLVGNHDKINEKSEDHSLNFLSKYANIVKDIRDKQHVGNFHLAAYQHDIDKFRKNLKNFGGKRNFIVHQGLFGTNSGEYIQDRTALVPDDVSGFRIISGHYHTRQTIKLPNGGQWDFIGNPYTLTFAEANDPEKGFQILHDDNSLEFVPTNLRKHIIIELTADKRGLHGGKYPEIKPEDLVWVKVSGPKEFVQKIDKAFIKKNWVQEANFKLDLIPTTSISTPVKKDRSVAQLLDSVIDGLTDVTPERKIVLKELWKGL